MKDGNENQQKQSATSAAPEASQPPAQLAPGPSASPETQPAPSVPLQAFSGPAAMPPPDARKHEADLHKHIATYGVIASFAINVIALIAATIHNEQNFSSIQKQIQLQQENTEQSRPIDFDVSSETLSTGDLRLSLKNRGRAEIVKIRGHYRYYFAFPDGPVRSLLAVRDLLKSDINLLNVCRDAGLLVGPEDVEMLLGATREFSVVSLDPTEKDSFEPEFSQASIQNAARLGRCLNARALMRWQFEYQHHISRQRFTHVLYLLVEPDSPAKPIIQVRAQTILDLNKTIGGKSLIDAIANFEETSKEVIFSKP